MRIVAQQVAANGDVTKVVRLEGRRRTRSFATNLEGRFGTQRKGPGLMELGPFCEGKWIHWSHYLEQLSLIIFRPVAVR
jgi:hypothetical protein